MCVLGDESSHGTRLEAEKVSPFHVRNPSLEYKSTDMANADAEPLRDFVDREQMLRGVVVPVVHDV